MEIYSNDEEDRFFDSREDISSVSDSGLDCVDSLDLYSRSFEWISGNLRYEVWLGTPKSVCERRDMFLKWMNLSSDLDGSGRSDSVYFSKDVEIDIDRIVQTSGAVSRDSDDFEDEFTSSRTSISSWSSNAADLSTNGVLEESFVCRIRNLDDGTEFIVDELERDGMLNMLREVGSNQLFTIDEFQRAVGLSPSVHQLMRRDVTRRATLSVESVKRGGKRGWLRRLGAAICFVDRQREESQLDHCDLDSGPCDGIHRVRIRLHRKRFKELSALYRGQEIQAHKGSILTMKFSLDGRYLATAGEDGIVRVWRVTECSRTDDEIPELDPACIYFTVNGSSEPSPLFVDKEKMHKFTRKTRDSACVIFPPKTVRISEKPVHEFHGHNGTVLDLSWSKNKYLLSSSEDNTVRLWQVGCSTCLKVFSHSNYVTCVQFNPVDNNYFVSGSIDGKVRIWAIPSCQVVDWTDIKEIVTAVCYRLDGQGVIIGSMTGDCRFYDASDNHLRLDVQVCLQGKKKSPKRIIGFQFSPSDPRKVMVVSADSQIRIIDGVEVICKYRGIQNSGSQISAAFTSDGSRIISVGEDSNVCIWNHNSLDGPLPQQRKSIQSCERFLSSNALVAIPWSGIKSETLASNEQVSWDSVRNPENVRHFCSDPSHNSLFSLSSQNSVSLRHEFFAEALPKGTATWPEEKLPTSSSLSPASAVCKSQYRFLKTSCQNTVTSHAWGLVIVTAGLDGRIRLFHNYGLPVRV